MRRLARAFMSMPVAMPHLSHAGPSAKECSRFIPTLPVGNAMICDAHRVL